MYKYHYLKIIIQLYMHKLSFERDAFSSIMLLVQSGLTITHMEREPTVTGLVSLHSNKLEPCGLNVLQFSHLTRKC